MKRILFVVNHAGFFLSHRLPVAIAAKNAGYDVHVATPSSKHVPSIGAAGIHWHSIDMHRSRLNPLSELRSFWSIYSLYRRLRPDLVHHVTSKPVLYGTIAARLAGVPAIVNAVSGTGYVFSENRRGGLRVVLRLLVGTVYRLALKHPNLRVIFQNRDQADDFVRRRWASAESVTLIPGSGADPDVFTPAAVHDEVPRVVLASRMLYTKGVEEFVAAARLLANEHVRARFVLVGEPDPDNPESIPLEKLRAWHDEGVVEYHGRSENMPEVFRAAEIVCLPTYYGEGVPKVLVEAAAAALPIVTTDWPGCRDVVRDGFNGYLVPIRNARAVADALKTLIVDETLRQRMGANGRASLREEFTLAGVLRKTLQTYTELIGDANS